MTSLLVFHVFEILLVAFDEVCVIIMTSLQKGSLSGFWDLETRHLRPSCPRPINAHASIYRKSQNWSWDQKRSLVLHNKMHVYLHLSSLALKKGAKQTWNMHTSGQTCVFHTRTATSGLFLKRCKVPGRRRRSAGTLPTYHRKPRA